MSQFVKNFFQNKIKTGVLILVVAVAGYFTYKHYSVQAAPVRYITAQASKQTIVSSVSGTGQVSEDRNVNITPQSSGKLTAVEVKQGQSVKAGQTIAIVDETNNSIALNQARASLASAQANYDQVLAGSTSQQVQLAKLAAQADQQALVTAQNNLQIVTKQQSLNVANAQTALLNSTLQAIPSATNLSNTTVALSGTYTGTAQGSYTVTAYNAGNGVGFALSGLESQTQLIQKNVPLALGTKGLFITFTGPNPASGDTWTISIPNTQASNYYSNSQAYQAALTTQTAALTDAQNQITSAQNKLDQDQINLQTVQQPPTSQALESAKASLTNAQAQLQNAEIAYKNNILTAPFDGTVAALNNQAGDQVSASTNVATLVTNQSIAIIPLNEVDVAQVKVGDKATMTFQAIDGLVISGTVAQVDSIGTVSQGVVTYNVKITFDTEDPRIKPGMSVQVSIITATAPDVLAVPNSAVQTQGGISYVQTLDPSKTQSAAGQTGVTSSVAPSRVTVQIGASNDTYTEISSGLKEGDTVVTQTINPSAAKSTAASATSALRLGGGAGGFGGGGARTTTGRTGN